MGVRIGSRVTVSVPVRGGGVADTSGYVVADGVAVTRRVPSIRDARWTVTDLASGKRMPGDFATRTAARAAWSTLLERVPDAPALVVALGAGTLPATDARRLRDAWMDALVGPRVHGWTLAELVAEQLPPDWEGDSDVLVCPCGFTIEHDGMCPRGCVSPFVVAGAI